MVNSDILHNVLQKKGLSHEKTSYEKVSPREKKKLALVSEVGTNLMT